MKNGRQTGYIFELFTEILRPRILTTAPLNQELAQPARPGQLAKFVADLVNTRRQHMAHLKDQQRKMCHSPQAQATAPAQPKTPGAHPATTAPTATPTATAQAMPSTPAAAPVMATATQTPVAANKPAAAVPRTSRQRVQQEKATSRKPVGHLEMTVEGAASFLKQPAGKGVSLLGHRVSVVWPTERNKSFKGCVTDYRESDGQHHIAYDDGEDVWEMLDPGPGQMTWTNLTVLEASKILVAEAKAKKLEAKLRKKATLPP